MTLNRTVCGVASLLAFALVGCNPVPTAEGPKKKPLTDLAADTVAVGLVPWPKTILSQGELRADEVVAIGTRVAGRVAKVHVELGDRVAANQPLVSIDPDEFHLLVEQAEAQLAQTRSAVGLAPDALVENLQPENAPPVRQERVVWDEAKSSLQRALLLKKQNAIAQGEYDLAVVAERVAETRYASALNAVREKIALIGVREAELRLAEQRLADATIVAPFDAFVQQRQVAPGAYLTVGAPVLSLVRTDPLWFRGTLPERHAADLKVGLKMMLKIESVNDPIAAEVSRISPALDPQSRSLVFEARLSNPENRLRTGLFAEAEIVLEPNATAVAIPESSISKFAGAEKVWQVKDSLSSEREIITGKTRLGMTEVIDGLTVGEVILSNGALGRVARIIPKLTPTNPPDTETKTAHAIVDEVNPVPEG